MQNVTDLNQDKQLPGKRRREKIGGKEDSDPDQSDLSDSIEGGLIIEDEGEAAAAAIMEDPRFYHGDSQNFHGVFNRREN